MNAAAATLPFSKYHGLGNDFVLVDARSGDAPPMTPAEAEAMCDRNFGVGADGVIFVLPPTAVQGGSADQQYGMRIYNSDGSEPEMCGNGIRCMARYVAAELESKGAGDAATYSISTLAGPIVPELLPDGQIKVDMGEPILNGADVPTTIAGDADGRVVEQPISVAGKEWKVSCVSMGNPHAIVFVDDLDAVDLAAVGPLFEAAFPAKTNTEFVQVLSHCLKMKVERGAGPTLACGARPRRRRRPRRQGRPRVHRDAPGRRPPFEWREADSRIFMTGPAEPTFRGEYASSRVGAGR